jgi:hypothetical protein
MERDEYFADESVIDLGQATLVTEGLGNAGIDVQGLQFIMGLSED